MLAGFGTYFGNSSIEIPNDVTVKNINIFFLFKNEDLRVRRQAFYGRRVRPRVSSGSEYYGQDGITPAYKLRQRNPYGGR